MRKKVIIVSFLILATILGIRQLSYIFISRSSNFGEQIKVGKEKIITTGQSPVLEPLETPNPYLYEYRIETEDTLLTIEKNGKVVFEHQFPDYVGGVIGGYQRLLLDDRYLIFDLASRDTGCQDPPIDELCLQNLEKIRNSYRQYGGVWLVDLDEQSITKLLPLPQFVLAGERDGHFTLTENDSIISAEFVFDGDFDGVMTENYSLDLPR